LYYKIYFLNLYRTLKLYKKMKTTSLIFYYNEISELDLDKFESITITQNRVYLIGLISDDLEKYILTNGFSKNEIENSYSNQNETITIILKINQNESNSSKN
jgi:hypothetical protein